MNVKINKRCTSFLSFISYICILNLGIILLVRFTLILLLKLCRVIIFRPLYDPITITAIMMTVEGSDSD